MKKNKFVLVSLIVSVILLVIGMIIAIIGLSGIGWKLSNLGADLPVAQTYTIENNIDELEFHLSARSIKFIKVSSDFKIETNNTEKSNLEYTITGNKLKVVEQNKWSFGSIISIFTVTKLDLTVYIPEVLENLTVKTLSGTVEFDGFTINNSLKISNTSGAINLSNITAQNAELSNVSGRISVENSVMTNVTCVNISGKNLVKETTVLSKTSLKNTSGNNTLEKLTCPEIVLENTSGRNEGSIVGSKADYTIFITQTIGSSNIQNQVGLTSNVLSVKNVSGKISITFE